MSENLILPQLDQLQLQEKLEAISFHDLIAVTILSGNILLGGIAKYWRWNGEVLSIAFNTPEGLRFGHSHVVDVPIDSIADVSLVPLDDSSTPRLSPDDLQIRSLRQLLGENTPIDPRLFPQDYPNPLATIIYEHNTAVTSTLGLSIKGYIERALPRDSIPPEGLYFDEDFLIYVDWGFFYHQAPGGVSLTGGILGVLEISKDVTKSLQQQVLQRLREHAIEEKVRRKLSPTMGECILHGCIFIKEPPDTTEIQGEECHLWTVVDGDGESYPVLVKVRMLKYPLEFIGRVNSVLTFYGELLPVPLNILGTTRRKTLLAHAIAYFHTN